MYILVSCSISCLNWEKSNRPEACRFIPSHQNVPVFKEKRLFLLVCAFSFKFLDFHAVGMYVHTDLCTLKSLTARRTSLDETLELSFFPGFLSIQNSFSASSIGIYGLVTFHSFLKDTPYQSSCTQVPHKRICLQNEGVGARVQGEL
jgi:hypothetical protein